MNKATRTIIYNYNILAIEFLKFYFLQIYRILFNEYRVYPRIFQENLMHLYNWLVTMLFQYDTICKKRVYCILMNHSFNERRIDMSICTCYNTNTYTFKACIYL